MVKNDIFGRTFNDARKCLTLTDRKKTELCHVSVGREIGQYLSDNELNSSEYGPTQLFFVKTRGDRFESLDWSGKLISETVNPLQKLLLDNKSIFFKDVLGVCNFFSKTPNYLLCEVFAPIKLDNQTQGYLGWKMAYKDGGDFAVSPIYMVYVAIVSPLLFISPIFNGQGSFALLGLIGFTISILPWIASGYLAFRYFRKSSNK